MAKKATKKAPAKKASAKTKAATAKKSTASKINKATKAAKAKTKTSAAATKATVKAKASKAKASEAKASKSTTAKAPKVSAKAAATKTTKATKSTKTKTTKSGLTQEVSKKAATKKLSAVDQRRADAAAAMLAALEDDHEEEDDDDDEFDPEAFLAASGGKGLIRSHVMRKERVDLHLPVRFRMMRGPLVFNAILLNLSKSGVCLETSDQHVEGTVLKIEIPLPHTSELFAVPAEVVWWNKISGTGKSATHHIGLNFQQMSLAKRTVINNFIQTRRDEIVMAKIGLDKFADSAPVSGLD